MRRWPCCQRVRHRLAEASLAGALDVLCEHLADEESSIMLGVLPAPARLAWRLIGHRQYTRRTTRIRAYLT